MKNEIAIIKAIGNPVRINILRHLVAGPSCVTLTNEHIKVSQPNLSQHLKVLKEAGLIFSKKMRNKRCYSLSKPQEIKKLLEAVEGLNS